MDNSIGLLATVGILSLLGVIVYYSIRTAQKEKEKRREAAAALGFAPLEGTAAFAEKVFPLYRHAGRQPNFELRHVFRRNITDGELYLFDLVDTSGEDENIVEIQGVAILSPYLDVPHFSLFPKADPKYALSGLANKIAAWGLFKMDTVVNFSEYPEFEARYIVTTEDNPHDVHEFFDLRRSEYFARTQLYRLRGKGDFFIFSELDGKFRAGDQEDVARRIHRAVEVFRILQN